MDSQEKLLLALARQARDFAHAPYSDFTVGACLQTEDGTYYTGCNVENASYGAANCAERTAFYKAISEGKTTFRRIAIVGGKKGEKATEFCFPCGICLQVMAEFCSPDSFEIILADSKTQQTYLLKELLPHSFSSTALTASPIQ